MAMTATQPILSERGALVERHWQELAAKRRIYTAVSALLLLLAVSGSLWFANETNAGKFFDRLPYLFDFVEELVPRDGWEIWRALFDLPSPYDDGSLKFNYPEGRLYVTESLYIPEYFHKMLETVNIALLSTVIAMIFGYGLAFLAAKNTMPSTWIRWPVRRFMELLRAFPEVVIAGFFLAILSLGPIPAIIAITIHTIGAVSYTHLTLPTKA
jgi:phosphonate transport system permease protein